MRAFVLVLIAICTMAVMAEEEDTKVQTNQVAGPPIGYQFGAYDMFQPRQVRWQAAMAPQGWMGAAGPLVAKESEYYPKLVTWLDTVGRRRRR